MLPQKKTMITFLYKHSYYKQCSQQFLSTALTSSSPAVQSTTVVPSSSSVHPSVVASHLMATFSTPTSATIPALSTTFVMDTTSNFHRPKVTQIVISLSHNEQSSSRVLIWSTSSGHISSHSSSPDILSTMTMLPQPKGIIHCNYNSAGNPQT